MSRPIPPHNVFALTRPAVHHRDPDPDPDPDTLHDLWAEEHLDNKPLTLVDKLYNAVGVVLLIAAVIIISWPE